MVESAQSTRMKDLDLSKTFGLLIAYVIPGWIGLAGLSYVVPSIKPWFGADANSTVGGFLFVLLGSIGMGLFIAALKYQTLERLLEKKKWVCPPSEEITVKAKKSHPDVYADYVRDHYQYYQFHSNTIFALIFTYCVWLKMQPSSTQWKIAIGIALLVAIVVLTPCSVNCLRKFDKKIRELAEETADPG